MLLMPGVYISQICCLAEGQHYRISKWIFTNTFSTKSADSLNCQLSPLKCPLVHAGHKKYAAGTVPANKKYAAGTPLTRPKDKVLILKPRLNLHVTFSVLHY